MHSHMSFCTFSLLSTLITPIYSYPTQSYLAPSSRRTPSSSSPQDPQTLYTTITRPIHPSRSGCLTVRPPTSPTSPNPFLPSSFPSSLSLPFTLTSTCPQIVPDWRCLTSDLLTNILLLYPGGPTSSPRYTFTPASESGSNPENRDVYSISETIVLPTTEPNVEFRSSLQLSIMPKKAAGIAGVSKDEWRIFIGLLHSVNGILEREMEGMGWGKLVMRGGFEEIEEQRMREIVLAKNKISWMRERIGEWSNRNMAELSKEWTYENDKRAIKMKSLKAIEMAVRDHELERNVVEKTEMELEKKPDGKKLGFGPSDVVFPSSSSSSTTPDAETSLETPSYPQELVKDWERELKEAIDSAPSRRRDSYGLRTPDIISRGKWEDIDTSALYSLIRLHREDDEKTEKVEEGDHFSFDWEATWTYYGVVRDENGEQVLRECAQMPLGLKVDSEGKGEEGDKGVEMKMERKNDEGGKGDNEREWKIDL